MSRQIFAQALPAVVEFSSPRAWAFALLGIQEYLQRLNGDRFTHQMRDSLTTRLMELYDRTARAERRRLEYPRAAEFSARARKTAPGAGALPMPLRHRATSAVAPALQPIGVTARTATSTSVF